MAELPEAAVPGLACDAWSSSTATGCRAGGGSRSTCGRCMFAHRPVPRRPPVRRRTVPALIASPAGAYFPGGVQPVSVWLSTEYIRAAPGGTGEAKCAGNYAASLLAQAAGRRAGLRPGRLARRGRAPLRRGDGRHEPLLRATPTAGCVTPALTGTLLPGVTRDSILRSARDLGLDVEERPITIEEWESGCADGTISEVFACGTAAVVTPVGEVKHAGGELRGRRRRSRARSPMKSARRCSASSTAPRPDPHGWMHRVG